MARICRACGSTVHSIDESDLYICGIHGVLHDYETEAINPFILR